jgi:hypothetical protein
MENRCAMCRVRVAFRAPSFGTSLRDLSHDTNFTVHLS